VNARGRVAGALLLAKFENKKYFKQEYCEWLATVRRDFYHAQLAFRKSKIKLNLLNLYDHF
jgi:hypothetical protein